MKPAHTLKQPIATKASPTNAAPAQAQPARKMRAATTVLIGLSLFDLALADKIIASCGVVLAVGSSTFAVSMIRQNLNTPASPRTENDYAYDVLYWKQPIISALPPTKNANTSSIASSASGLDLTPLGTLPSKAKTEENGTISGYSLVIAGKGTAVLQGRRGFSEVRVGTHLDADHEVTAIEQRGANWVVVTNKGIISALTQ